MSVTVHLEDGRDVVVDDAAEVTETRSNRAAHLSDSAAYVLLKDSCDCLVGAFRMVDVVGWHVQPAAAGKGKRAGS